MVIEDKEIIKIIYHIYHQYFDHKDLKIQNVGITVGESINIKLSMFYCNIPVDVNIITNLFLENDKFILQPKGIVKYGLLKLDLFKMINEFACKYDFIAVKNQQIMIKNEFVESLKYGSNKIELTLK